MTAAAVPTGPAIPKWLRDAVASLVDGLVAQAYEAGRAEALASIPAVPTASVAPPSAPPMQDTLTRKEAARYIRRGLTKFDELARRGEFHTFKIEGRLYARRAELQAWLDRHAESA